jgi:acyl dehydratase
MGQKVKRQIFYEDVAVGMELPSLVKCPTTRQLVQWAGASGDYFEIHYDKDFALSQGLPGVIVQGWLILSFIGQMLTDWVGDEGALRKMSCSYRGMHYPSERLTCKGKVTGKYIEDDKHYVECEVWAENPRGEIITPGTAVVILPSREEMAAK